jgi:hypothetical protein
MPRGQHHAHAGPDGHEAAGRVPFWIHQLAELLLGLLLLVEGARTGEHTAVLVALGGLLLALALCSDGALGAWRWIGRRVHRVLDLVVAAVLALSPLVLGLDQVVAIVLLELAAAAVLWLALRTEWRPKPTRAERRRAPLTDAPPPAPTPSEAAPARSRPVPSPPLARKLGGAVGRARDDGPRQLGRLVGRARRAARAAMAPDPESAEPPAPPRARDRPERSEHPDRPEHPDRADGANGAA